MSQLKKGAVLSYINIILTSVIGLAITPFIINSLGDSEYGLYMLIGSFVSYLTLMDFGLNNTIIRFVAKYRAEKDITGERRFLGTIMLIYCAISAVLIIIGLFLFFQLDSIFYKTLSVNQIAEAKIMFIILVFNIAITLPGGAFTAICSSYERFVFPKVISIVRYLLRTLTIVVILIFWEKAVALVLVDTIFNVLVVSVTVIYVLYKLKVKFDFKKSDWKTVKHIFSYSLWIFIFAIVQTFQWNAGQVVLGINVNTTIVAIYSVGIMLGLYYGAFASAINGVLLPRATQMVTESKSPLEITQTMIKYGRINNFLSLLILSGFILFGKEFILLWVGDVYKDSWAIALLIMLVLTIPLSQGFGNSILEASNKVSYKAILNLITMFIGVISGFFLSKVYGIFGMIFPIVIALGINILVTNVYFIKVFNFKAVMFFRETFIKQFLIVSILVVIFYLVKREILFDNWIMLGIGIAVYTLLYIPVYYFFSFNQFEKDLIKYRIKANS